MTPEQFTAVLGAFTAFLVAGSAAYIKIRDRVDQVHVLVNSQLDEVKGRLDGALEKVEQLRTLIAETSPDVIGQARDIIDPTGR